MAKKTVNIGTSANKGNGDPLRTAFGKINDNFDELYALTGDDVQIPAQTTHTGKFLTTNGTTLSWASGDGDRLVNGASTVSLSSTGILTLPNGAVIKDTTNESVAFGQGAGQTSQGEVAVAIGYLAGQTSQGNAAVAVGADAGRTSQGLHAVAVGTDTGATSQGNRAVAIGYLAGGTAQGTESVAIGYYAGELNQGNNSIIINASGTALQQTTANTFTVAPIRNAGGTSGVLQYNAATKEVTYSSDIQSEGAVNIDINLSDSTLRRWRFSEGGDTVFPNNVSINYSGNNIQFPRIIADSGKAFSVQGQGTSGSAALSWTVNPDAAGQYAAVGVSRAGGDNLAKVVIQAQSDSGDAGTVKLWKFDETGKLTLPTGGNISENGGLTGNAIKLTPAGGANANQALLIYPTAAAEGDHIHLTAGGG